MVSIQLWGRDVVFMGRNKKHNVMYWDDKSNILNMCGEHVLVRGDCYVSERYGRDQNSLATNLKL